MMFVFLIMLIGGCSCNKEATVAEAILDIGTEEGDNSRKYDLDERFSYFQLFSANGEGWLHLNNEEEKEKYTSILSKMKNNINR